MFSMVFKGPTRQDLEPDLTKLSKEEQAIIQTVIQKDLELRCQIASESNGIISEWNQRVSNLSSISVENEETVGIKNAGFFVKWRTMYCDDINSVLLTSNW